MDAKNFEQAKQAAVEQNEALYGAEARERFGDETVDAANAKLLAMDEAEWASREELEDAIIEQLKMTLPSGDPQSINAWKLVEMHKNWLCMHWPEGAYSPEAHVSLAQGYLADPRFVEYYDSRAGAGACMFLVAAIKKWAA